MPIESSFSLMPYTPRELEALKRDFARRQRRQVVVGGLAVLVFLVVVLYERQAVTRFPLSVVWMTLVAGLFIFSWWNWRCPACDRYLGKYPGRSCPKCGAPLRGDSLG